ncbi:MAG: hypothetical protein VZR53_05345 [Prevotella sp.]|nr:hypothetical protein [Prevotella sp.]
MDKLTMHTTDGVNANHERLEALFPNCVTETTDKQENVQLAVDYDKLRVEFGEVVEGFDRKVHETTVTEIAKQKPNFFVMRDASVADDNVIDNFE